jgi:hypothetical protein
MHVYYYYYYYYYGGPWNNMRGTDRKKNKFYRCRPQLCDFSTR